MLQGCCSGVQGHGFQLRNRQQLDLMRNTFFFFFVVVVFRMFFLRKIKYLESNVIQYSLGTLTVN